MNDVQCCTRCVMDNRSDDTIVFDDHGVCNYCSYALARKDSVYFPDNTGYQKLTNLVERIKHKNRNKSHDCIMGLSGGLDSSYLAYLGHTWGLRILAVHIDDGFDTEISKNNIRKLCDACSIELITIKPNVEQFYALTKAYMNAGVPNLAIPQDNVLLAELHIVAKKTGIRYFLSGGNFALECILQQDNTYTSLDVVNVKDINKRYGSGPIDKLRFISGVQLEIDRIFYNIESPRPLNFISYNREKALSELKSFCDFDYYGGKHLENTLTAFIQLYWLYHKFGVDKRTSHLSSMIVSGQMTRKAALKEMEQPVYEPQKMKEIIETVLNKLQMTHVELDQMMKAPNHRHQEYMTDRLPNLFRKIIRILGPIKKIP